MKFRATDRFRSMLRAGENVYGLWVTLESPSITEMAVALGFDWVVIDAEHGHLDWKEIVEHIRATVRSDTVLLVRVAEQNTALIKRALDLGADGVVVPWVETETQLQTIIDDCRYPPSGRRGIGAERATLWGQCFHEHTAGADEHVLVIPLIESVSAIEAVPAMCALEGVETFFFGPADFSATAGYVGQWEGPGVGEQILALKQTIRDAGKHCGVVTTGIDNLNQRKEQGFQMLALGTDTGLLLKSLHDGLRSVGRDRQPATSFDPRDGVAIVDSLAQPPAEMKPDREEVIASLANSQSIELQQGVTLKATVGEFNNAKQLTTGIVQCEPEAFLDLHRHPCSESITVLDGTIEVTVEGRVYLLNKLDNIVIPRWLPHAARNPSPEIPSQLHVALASCTPERELVSQTFEHTLMPADSVGLPGFERVNRFAAAKRTTNVGPNSEFVDYFNADLMPGIEMSGGYGLFNPGGRLPAHCHDFDESICIIDGTANCVVEGRCYEMSDCETAMVPRGRVHYFTNQSKSPMAMIWVYAGPRPERIVVAEKCATAKGSPWK